MFSHEMEKIEAQAHTMRSRHAAALARDLFTAARRALTRLVTPTPREELMALSDRELLDIGVNRSEIDYVVAHGREERQRPLRPRLAVVRPVAPPTPANQTPRAA